MAQPDICLAQLDIYGEFRVGGTAKYMHGTAGYIVYGELWVDDTAGYMHGTAGYMVAAHVILVSP